jgi:hypothetical protein
VLVKPPRWSPMRVTTVMVDNTFEWSSAGGLVSYYSHAGHVIAMRNTTGVHWLFGDHLGSNSTVRTPAGTNIRQRYLPFGRLRVASGVISVGVGR